VTFVLFSSYFSLNLYLYSTSLIPLHLSMFSLYSHEVFIYLLCFVSLSNRNTSSLKNEEKGNIRLIARNNKI
jgi:hypothetical protein